MEFIFVFTIIFSKVFLIHLFKIMEIVRTFWIDAFMYAEELTVFFGDEGVSAVRTGKAKRCCNDFTGAEGLTTDFTLVLTVTSIIVVYVVMWSPTQRADGIFRNGFTITALNWFYRLTVFPLIVFKKKQPVLFDKGFDDRKLIDLKFLILWGMGIIKAPLLKRDISADKVNQPTVLLIKLMA